MEKVKLTGTKEVWAVHEGKSRVLVAVKKNYCREVTESGYYHPPSCDCPLLFSFDGINSLASLRSHEDNEEKK